MGDTVGQGTRSTAAGTWLLVLPTDGRPPELSAPSGVRDLSWAVSQGTTAVLSGRFYGLDQPPDVPPIQALLAAVRKEGPAFLGRLGGFFAVVVWDDADHSLLCARDPLGIHPLFWTRTSAGLMLSPSVDTLLRQAEVATRVNRAAVADHLRHLWPRPEETYFEGISRVLPGHWLRVTGAHTTTERYWDPLFPGQHPAWIDEADLGRFDQLLDESVGRLTTNRSPAIYLSGGLDSVSVGALATDHARQRQEQPPHAFSLAFPEPFSEEDLQRSVASQLGMRQLVARLEDALAGDGIVRAAFERGAVGAPLQNPWLPAYRWLAGQAKDRGCDTILTGSGGDEWLTVTPVYAADLLRSGRLLELAELGRTQARSFNVAPWLLARNLV
jgi:asparagine synthase (glutamine-hydrolysing)